MSESIANRDESRKCAALARKALAEGDFGKAEKWANKAFSMYRSDEVGKTEQKQLAHAHNRTAMRRDTIADRNSCFR